MKKLMVIALSLILSIAWQSSWAQIDVISAKDAAALLSDGNTVFVSTRTLADYQKVHVKGAVHIDHNSLYGDMTMLKSSQEVAKILGDNGISDQSRIILYDDGSGRYAGRMYWILTYMGADKVQIIDGGMKGWRMARKPVTKNPTTVASTTFNANVNKSILATMSEVKSAIDNGSYVLVDVRSSEEFEGKATANVRPGHIPSAVNLNFASVLDERGMIKPESELTALFTEAGITKGKTVILYCQTSVRAGIVFAALRGLDYSKVKVYDGAYMEWQSLSANKVAMR